MNKIKQIIIRVSDEVHQQLRLKVLKDNTSVQELLNNYIERYLNEKKDNEEIAFEILTLSSCLSQIQYGAKNAEKEFKKILKRLDMTIISSDDEEPI